MEVFFNHLNPAKIKYIMLQMNKQEFVETALFIKSQLISLEAGNKRRAYLVLYKWSREIYKTKHQ